MGCDVRAPRVWTNIFEEGPIGYRGSIGEQ
eukprot:COSAG01_NODE_59424_length_300_cov_0.905473_1_plen_29_part_10